MDSTIERAMEVLKDGWDESLHPRDESGRFSMGGALEKEPVSDQDKQEAKDFYRQGGEAAPAHHEKYSSANRTYHITGSPGKGYNLMIGRRGQSFGDHELHSSHDTLSEARGRMTEHAYQGR